MHKDESFEKWHVTFVTPSKGENVKFTETRFEWHKRGRKRRETERETIDVVVNKG